MKAFNHVLLDLTIIFFPIIIYLIYIAYVKILNEEESDLIFNLTIISQVYFIIRYKTYTGPFIINIPLILLYKKKSKILSLIISAIIILYYYKFYNNYLIVLIIEYSIYYLLNLKINKINIYITLFAILKTVFIIFYNKGLTLEIMFKGILFYIITFFANHFLNKTKEVLKLHKSIKEIEHDKQIKTSLFKITHEIKNPIAVCKGYLDMYDENKMKEFKKCVPILKEEIDRTLVLLEDFLAMNKLKINKDILDINLLLEEVIKSMELLFVKNRIKIEKNITEDEIFINGDYNRLTQVFINILKNSVEALENKKEKTIGLWSKLGKDNITIYIKDNGEGIKKEILNKIKEPFYTTKIKGTGLGVSLSNEIISGHEGYLNYESKEGEYTLVTIILPLEKAI
ncbi:MAG: HAMP domain-containing histidine kinase [Bacilli bacterium]|nr:HAMP domain-containing histidine kinase [Bacilli bacterium]